VTEFAIEVRHYCRNPKCRSKLKSAVSNPREAFCARGCYTSFYRKRCLVCEEAMERRTEHQLVCGKRLCRNALQGGFNGGRYHASSSVINPLKTSIKPGVKSGVRGDRPELWTVVAAGTPIRANQYHCATVPDGPNCEWANGEYERIEAKNRAALKAAGL
jgi:hypothetical protein